ncbi:zinc ribbon domain-containing protein [Candidatus Bathyarchaeota archaeon]|nr:zinc ribbon domain-containing protein [Candidatus Bathyarchaeota archaeon]
MESAASPIDPIIHYKNAGFAVLLWKKPESPEDRYQVGFAQRLEEKGFRIQVLTIPQPPPGYAAPPYHFNLAFTILDPSVADTILNLASSFLSEFCRDAAEVTAKVDVILEHRIISAEAHGSPVDVGGTIRNIQEIERLVSSNLVVMVADQELNRVPPKFCSRCGVPMPAQSEYCIQCGERQ